MVRCARKAVTGKLPGPSEHLPARLWSASCAPAAFLCDWVKCESVKPARGPRRADLVNRRGPFLVRDTSVPKPINIPRFSCAVTVGQNLRVYAQCGSWRCLRWPFSCEPRANASVSTSRSGRRATGQTRMVLVGTGGGEPWPVPAHLRPAIV